MRAAEIAGLSVAKFSLIACFLGGAAAALAGVVEVAAVHGHANDSLAGGYGYAGILVAFVARQNPLAIIPVAILLGGVAAAAICCRCSSASAAPACRSSRAFSSWSSSGWTPGPGRLREIRQCVVPRLIASVLYASATANRLSRESPMPAPMSDAATALGYWGVPLAICRRRDPQQHAVHLRQPRRDAHGEERPHQPRPGRHARDGRDGRVRRLVPRRAARTSPADRGHMALRAVARRPRRGPGGVAAGRAARLALLAATRERRRRRHRHHALRHGPGVLPRQAVRRARPPRSCRRSTSGSGATPSRSARPQDQLAVLHRRRRWPR